MSGMIGRAFLPLALLIANGLAQSPQASDVVIRSSAREVLLDLVVRDAHGKLVTNLKPEDVAVYQDGVRQDVRSFRLVAGSEVRLEDERQAADAQAAAAMAASAPVPRPPVNPLRTVNVVCLILSDLNADTRAFAFESARKFVDKELRPNTFIGIFTLDSTGLRPVFPFSNNRDRLLKAVQLASVNQLPAMNLHSAAMLNGLSTQVGVAGLGSRGSVDDALGSQHDMTFAATQGLREIDALKGLIAQLGPLPFHKTLLLLGTGLTRPPDQLEYWDSMIRSAIAGGVTFYAADVYGLGVCQDDPNPNCGAQDPPHSAAAPAQAMLSYAASLSAQQGSASLQSLQPPPGVIGNLGPRRSPPERWN